jgi:hypothetical protein
MNRLRSTPTAVRTAALAALLALVLPAAAFAHDPPYTEDFARGRCTFVAFGNNPYFPLWPGLSLLLEGEEEDEGETVELTVLLTVLSDTEIVDGVRTRVFEERESEDGELVEVSRNFAATCRETGDVWYFGEDVDIYEDGEVVSHDGAWRAGVDGSAPGILMPGTPLAGARFFQEMAPGVALDRAEIISVDETLEVPFGTFEDVVEAFDTNALVPEEEGDPKFYAPGLGLIKDEVIELTEVELPACLPDEHTLCLNDGRFRVTVEWADFDANEGMGNANQISDDSGEMWFFNENNTEMLIKVLDGCAEFGRYWVFAAGLTNVEVDVTVVDTVADDTMEYHNPLGNPFDPILDTEAFVCE